MATELFAKGRGHGDKLPDRNGLRPAPEDTKTSAEDGRARQGARLLLEAEQPGDTLLRKGTRDGRRGY